MSPYIIPVVSVNQPATISLSASGKSNGILSNSAREDIKKTKALIGSKNIFQIIYCDLAISVRLREDDSKTTGNADKKNGISKAIIWWRALSPPMKGYLLLL